MSFFNRKKNNKITITTISPQVLIRKIIYDSGCTDPEAVALVLGLSPISDEVAEMEEQASTERVSRIAALLPIIEAHASIAAQVAAASYATESLDLEDADLPDETLAALVTLFKFVSFSASMTCLAALVDMNILSERYSS